MSERLPGGMLPAGGVGLAASGVGAASDGARAWYPLLVAVLMLGPVVGLVSAVKRTDE